MQSRIRFLIYSAAYDGWLNKLADGHTNKIFSAMWFPSFEEAEHWLQNYDKAPRDKENYEIQRTKTTMEVEPIERNELISENQQSHAGHPVLTEG